MMFPNTKNWHIRSKQMKKITDKDKSLIKKWYSEGVKPEHIADRLGQDVESIKRYLNAK